MQVKPGLFAALTAPGLTVTQHGHHHNGAKAWAGIVSKLVAHEIVAQRQARHDIPMRSVLPKFSFGSGNTTGLGLARQGLALLIGIG